MTDAHDYTRCCSQDCPVRLWCRRWAGKTRLIGDTRYREFRFQWFYADEGRVVCEGMLV